MAYKAKKFFQQNGNGGGLIPAMIAFGGFAGGVYYLYKTSPKRGKSEESQPKIESKLPAPKQDCGNVEKETANGKEYKAFELTR